MNSKGKWETREKNGKILWFFFARGVRDCEALNS